MNNAAVYDELDLAVEKILSGQPIDADRFDPLVDELLPLAEDLRTLPRAEFRSHLLAELESVEKLQFLPAFFRPQSSYPVSRSNFAISAAMHAALLALLCTSSLWVVQHKAVPQRLTTIIADLSPYLLGSSPKPSSGGGGGGDRDILPASKGAPPRFSNQQITPPAIVVRNNDPKLAMEPTVAGPPAINFSKLETGDPLSNVLNPSNGFGYGSGIGTGGGAGIGTGYGAGVGAGYGGGLGGGIFRIGNGVSAPRVLYSPDPQYTDEARKAHYQGVVVLAIVVGPDGRTHDAHIARSLGMGLDERAIEAVRQWKFSPALKDGQPVAVLVNVEVSFRLY